MSKRSRSTSRTPSKPSSSPSPSPDRTKIHLSDPHSHPPLVMRCSLPPHRDSLSFASYEDYEVHYFQTHVNRCVECGGNFPTAHFLELHIEENHDPLVVGRRERGERTYGCFTEGCDRKCSTPQKRRRHLIDKHMFPPSYNFSIINNGIDKQTSMLRSPRRRISATPAPEEGRLRRRLSANPHNTASESAPAQGTASQQQDPAAMEVDELAKSMSALRFVPPSVTKGKVSAGRKS